MAERLSTQERILREQREREIREQRVAGMRTRSADDAGIRARSHPARDDDAGYPRVGSIPPISDSKPDVQSARFQTPPVESTRYAGHTASAADRSRSAVQVPYDARRSSPQAFSGAHAVSGYAPAPAAGDWGAGQCSAQRASHAKGSKKKRGPWNIVFYVSIGVLVVCVVALVAIVGMYFAGRNANSEFQDTAAAPTVSDYEGKTLAELTVDWDALLAINPETVGWICMPGTMINYPVVQTSDNETYLSKEFGGNYGALVKFGTIFVDYQNSTKFTDRVNFLYGHNMNDGSMFAQVADLTDSAAFNEHRTIYLLTPTGNFRLTSYALCHVNENDPVVQTKFGSDEAYTAYVQDKIDTSVVSPDPAIPSASEITKTFALSTCDNTITTTGRLILYCYVAESTSDYAGGLDANAQSDAQNALAETEIQGTADIIVN